MDKKTILVIDDASEVRKLLRFHLENKKYNVLEAADGEEGLKSIHARQPDLIILDINMPKVSGLQVYQALIAGTGHSLFPVLVLTTREELGLLFRDLNVDGFITKPFEVGKVLTEVDTIFAKRYRAGGAKAPKRGESLKKILIVENDPDDFNKVIMSFITAGYNVSGARSCMDAIDKIMTDLPEMILVKLGLPDLSGDLLIAKFKQMPRTMDLPMVLYTPHKSTIDRSVAEKICEKTGVQLVCYDDVSELVGAVKMAVSGPS